MNFLYSQGIQKELRFKHISPYSLRYLLAALLCHFFISLTIVNGDGDMEMIGVVSRFVGYSDVFHCWVEELLLTQLPENSVIIMDNASFHKRQDTQQLIADAGHHILWLPPYSPDLNPIEKMWAWLKRKRKDWRLDCIDKLFFYFLWICNSFLFP